MISYVERMLIYPAPSIDRGNWKTKWLDKEDVHFESSGGVRLHGWYAPVENPDCVVLYSHGQSEHVANLINVVARLQESLNASVLVYDYRGYGKSQGVPTEAGCVADGLAAQQWLAERAGVLPEELVIVGRSLGGAVSTAIAAERGARALVLENTFSRLTDVAAYRYPWLPVRQVMRNRYDSVERISQYTGPLFQMHGTRDRVVPAKFARELFSACPSAHKRFYTVRGGNHFDSTPPAFYAKLREFLAQDETPTSYGLLDPAPTLATPSVA
ncbi:putative aminoacrylate hydrolase RutD [Pseudobythopirellula maris]|uniref:Putative aminoacrylate hydrolase RutD n=1 Tax=Pseudobythopirellula maris TaxID=2527991 RepID=A0A5C5ZHC5_9BACT|nr:alpha/beta hydrolase [Pseudobythopirellula maris]TWT86558.1 putative aminoacrylate hydrolase RutD [Pseudobythopirellula maris]